MSRRSWQPLSRWSTPLLHTGGPHKTRTLLQAQDTSALLDKEAMSRLLRTRPAFLLRRLDPTCLPLHRLACQRSRLAATFRQARPHPVSLALRLGVMFRQPLLSGACRHVLR